MITNWQAFKQAFNPRAQPIPWKYYPGAHRIAIRMRVAFLVAFSSGLLSIPWGNWTLTNGLTCVAWGILGGLVGVEVSVRKHRSANHICDLDDVDGVHR